MCSILIILLDDFSARCCYQSLSHNRSLFRNQHIERLTTQNLLFMTSHETLPFTCGYVLKIPVPMWRDSKRKYGQRKPHRHVRGGTFIAACIQRWACQIVLGSLQLSQPLGSVARGVTSCIRIKNPSQRDIVYKVKTTAPRDYCVRPNGGHLPAGSEATLVGIP